MTSYAYKIRIRDGHLPLFVQGEHWITSTSAAGARKALALRFRRPMSEESKKMYSISRLTGAMKIIEKK